MKKIMRSKFEGMSTSPETVPCNMNVAAQEEIIQPPLPAGPPPPDCPTPIIIKKEIEDNEHIEQPQANELAIDKTLESKIKVKDPRDMCKDFIKGVCIKGSACKFKHEIDLSQLDRLFKFCWDFQNKGCHRPVCNHVHGTIFQQQHFLRTGYIPTYVFAHIKHEKSAPKADISNDKQNCNYQMMMPSQTHPDHQMPEMAISPTQNSDYNLQVKTSVVKRKMSDDNQITQFSGNQADYVCSEQPFAKKCNKCDLNELRVDISATQIEDKRRSILRLKENTSMISKKTRRVFAIIEDYYLQNESPQNGTQSFDKELKDLQNDVLYDNNMVKLIGLFLNDRHVTETKSV